MKTYGAKKSTEFTKKQIGMIFRLAKNGELKVEKWYMARLYDLADYYGYDDNRSVEQDEKAILGILDEVFAGNIQKAQELINRDSEKIFGLYGRKTQDKCNRDLV